jgi:hypothetical protein
LAAKIHFRKEPYTTRRNDNLTDHDCAPAPDEPADDPSSVLHCFERKGALPKYDNLHYSVHACLILGADEDVVRDLTVDLDLCCASPTVAWLLREQPQAEDEVRAEAARFALNDYLVGRHGQRIEWRAERLD